MARCLACRCPGMRSAGENLGFCLRTHRDALPKAKVVAWIPAYLGLYQPLEIVAVVGMLPVGLRTISEVLVRPALDVAIAEASAARAEGEEDERIGIV
jgi:hypothetical protein